MRIICAILISFLLQVSIRAGVAESGECEMHREDAWKLIKNSLTCKYSSDCKRFDTECGCWIAVNTQRYQEIQKAWKTQESACKGISFGCGYICAVDDYVSCYHSRCERLKCDSNRSDCDKSIWAGDNLIKDNNEVERSGKPSAH